MPHSALHVRGAAAGQASLSMVGTHSRDTGLDLSPPREGSNPSVLPLDLELELAGFLTEICMWGCYGRGPEGTRVHRAERMALQVSAEYARCREQEVAFDWLCSPRGC